MIILLGPTGAGKTVQAKMLAKEYGMFWLSAGELLRKTDDPEIKAKMRAGELVDDQKVNQVVGDTLRAVPLNQTVVMDGFPREMVQAKWLENEMQDMHRNIRAVVHIVISDEVATKRLLNRGREDDNKASIKERLDHMYREQVVPVVSFYKAKGLLREVDGEQSIQGVHESIIDTVSDVAREL